MVGWFVGRSVGCLVGWSVGLSVCQLSKRAESKSSMLLSEHLSCKYACVSIIFLQVLGFLEVKLPYKPSVRPSVCRLVGQSDGVS